jgi:hypothetical protein
MYATSFRKSISSEFPAVGAVGQCGCHLQLKTGHAVEQLANPTNSLLPGMGAGLHINLQLLKK